MPTYTMKEIEYLNRLNIDSSDLKNASYQDLENIENLLLEKIHTSLKPPLYESTEEAIICQNILDKLFDD